MSPSVYSRSENPRIAVMGVRISWLMLARNSLFAVLAVSASSFAVRNASTNSTFFPCDAIDRAATFVSPASPEPNSDSPVSHVDVMLPSSLILMFRDSLMAKSHPWKESSLIMGTKMKLTTGESGGSGLGRN